MAQAFDPAATAACLQEWLAAQVGVAGARGAVLNLSGGLDSAVVAGLCARALPGRVKALLLPCHSDPTDGEHARLVAAAFGVPTVEVVLDPVFDALVGSLEAAYGTVADPGARQARANVKARLRMTSLYYFANRLNYLAVGTGNLSELTVGYFTKYGDGGVDLLPIGGLVKGEVRELARYLGVPQVIIAKPPTAGLWPGQTDEGELGFAYAELDAYIRRGVAPPPVAARIQKLHAASQHKRVPPPVPPGPACD